MDTQHFKLLLEQQKSELEKQLNNVATKDPSVEGNYEAKYPNLGSDLDENADEVEGYVQNISEEQELEVDLAEVSEALEKIQNGTYGKCEKCEVNIEEERLKAFPAAKYCIKCNGIK